MENVIQLIIVEIKNALVMSRVILKLWNSEIKRE